MTFDEFAAARLSAVLRSATALTGDPDLAKDLVQEVLIRVSRRWQQIGQLDRPEAYITRFSDHYRRPGPAGRRRLFWCPPKEWRAYPAGLAAVRCQSG